MISEDELKQLEELERLSTKGIWECVEDKTGFMPGLYHIFMPEAEGDRNLSHHYPNNVRFIVAAKNLLPRLLQGYREMRGKLIENERHVCNDFTREVLNKLSQKDAVIEKMRECLEEITEYPEERMAYDLAKQCLKDVGE